MSKDSLAGLLPNLEAMPPISEAALSTPSDESSFVLRPFVGPLVISYIVDDGDGDRALRQRDLSTNGLSEAQLHDRAVENLARHVQTVGIRLRPYGSLMAVLFDGDMEATLMLYPTLWTKLCEDMGDELVVAVPARDVLAVSPLDSPQGIAELRAIVKRVWPTDDHALTTQLFELGDGGWSLWKVPPS